MNTIRALLSDLNDDQHGPERFGWIDVVATIDSPVDDAETIWEAEPNISNENSSDRSSPISSASSLVLSSATKAASV